MNSINVPLCRSTRAPVWGSSTTRVSGNFVSRVVLAAFGLAVSGLASPEPLGLLRLTETQVDRLAIELAPVRPAQSLPLATLPGRVMLPAHGREAVASPFAGVVIRVAAQLGEAVTEGDALISILSPGVLEAQAARQSAEAELQVAEAALRRLSTLASEGIVAEARVDEAEANAARARATRNEHVRLLSFGGAEASPDGTLVLRAPRSGRIVSIAALPGESIAALQPAAIIDFADTLWVKAQAPVDLIGRAAVGDAVAVLDGRGEPEVAGRVVSIGTTVDPDTRSVELYAELPRHGDLAPGQSVTLSIAKAVPLGTLQTPRRALVQIDGKPTLFVRNNDGFEPTPVSVLGGNASVAVVSGALNADAMVAVSGLSEMKSMVLAE